MDLGLTHIALPVTDLRRSIAFWSTYADMSVVHSRVDDDEHPVCWLADGTRPFVIVLIRHDDAAPLTGWAHLGVAVASRTRVDELAARARAEGHSVVGPIEGGPVAGYLAIIEDPDGHHLEISHGQDVTAVLADADPPGPESAST